MSDANVDRDTALLRDAVDDWLHERIDYERNHRMAYRGRGLKLDRMFELLARLGNPHQQLKVVHVAGTKGKGSMAVMTAAVLKAAGYRVGLFTSPHLDRVEQRLVVGDANQAGQDGVDANHEVCSAAQFVDLAERVAPVVTAMDRKASSDGTKGPTFFEITTAMAMLHFVQQQVDLAVLEVGLGGRLDSTNVCQPLVSVITSISFDHVQQLGNSLASIAREKAGIIKPGVPVVSGVVEDEPRQEIQHIARERGSRLSQLGRDFTFRYQPTQAAEMTRVCGMLEFQDATTEMNGIELGLLGRHQAANAAVALATLSELRLAGWSIPASSVRRGLASASLPARIEIMGRQPVVIVDSAHNMASVRALLDLLDESFTSRPRLLIFAATTDKDVRGMLSALLPAFDEIVLTRYENNPRSVDPRALQALSAELSDRPTRLLESPRDAWQFVSGFATPEHLITITGSFFLAAEMRQLVQAHPLKLLPRKPLLHTGGRIHATKP